MASFQSLVRTVQAATVRQAAPLSLAELAVIIDAADHAAAAARAAAPRAAAARAAPRAGARRRARPAAARQAAAAVAAHRVLAGAPRQIAGQMLAQDGWSGQFSCLDELWGQESSWQVYAENPSSGAYGIPQALPGSKMASAGPDWQSDAATQVSWGLGYIRATYGSPCAAWDHEEAAGWY